jgi:hypothetical protein
MKKLVFFLVALGALAFGNGPVRAQNCALYQSSNGPYYATPAWDQKIQGTQRFICLFDWNNEAVLDRETGLVWQRTPAGSLANFHDAVFGCYFAATGGRRGWRLPAPEELLSLIDPTQSNPALPAGHPFQGISIEAYWSATTLFPPTPTTSGGAVFVNFNNGGVGSATTDGSEGFWCVRGGSHLLTDFATPVP